MAQAVAFLEAEARAGGLAFDAATTPFSALDPLRAASASPSGARLRLAFAALLGRRLCERHGAFWFPERELPAGALGFPRAIIAVDPVALVDDAVAAGALGALDDRARELAEALARAGDAPAGAALGPADYIELFDPGFVQFLIVDDARAAAALALPAGRAADALDEALASSALAPDVREALERGWLSPLRALEASTPLAAALSTSPSTAAPPVGSTMGSTMGSTTRAVERFARLAAAVAAGAPAEEGFFADVVVRLLPPPPPGPRLLGLFPLDAARPLVPGAAPARLFLVDADVRSLLVSRAPPGKADARGDLLALAQARLDELRALVAGAGAGASLAFRRLTSSEAAAEDATAAVARALAPLARGW